MNIARRGNRDIIVDMKRPLFNSIDWDEDSKPELAMHSVHQYPAKFPAFIAAKAIDYARRTGLPVKSMADVFCGCGTSALEAKISGIDFRGIDIDPVAVLIARAKSHTYDADVLRQIEGEILKHYYLVCSNPYNPEELQNARIRYWFDEKTINALSMLKASIFAATALFSKEREAFLCIFSSILKPCSRWLAKSIKPQIDPKKAPKDCIALFAQQTRIFIRSVESFNKEVSLFRGRIPAIDILRGDVLNFQFQEKVDLIVSSPPYATSYEYADIHQLSALWLDFTDDYRTLRNGSIGSSYNTEDVQVDPKKLNIEGESIIKKLKERHVPPARIRSLMRYYSDMEQVARQCFSYLEDRGLLIFVIGDTTIRDVELNNSDHFMQALVDAGFQEVCKTKRKISRKALTPYRQENGRFAKSDTGRTIYKNEYVIMGRKHV